MKRQIKLISLIMVTALLGGCTQNSEAVSSSNLTTVAVTRAVDQSYENTVSYSGFVSADEVKRFSFELSGKINNVAVEEGQAVSVGQVLATLDTKTVQMAIDNANENIRLANNQIQQIDSGIDKIKIGLEGERLNLSKAQTALDVEKTKLEKIKSNYQSNIAKVQLQYDNIKSKYEDTQKMYEGGVVSKNDLDSAKLAFDTVQEELNNACNTRDNDIALQEKSISAAEETYNLQLTAIKNMENELETTRLKRESALINLNQAKISLEENTKYLTDSTLKSTIDGYVMTVTLKGGEVTSAGTPVVVIKSGKQIVNVGIPTEDIKKLKEGMTAILDVDGDTCQGVISRISLYPDETSRTYNIEISSDENKYAMGSLVNVKIPIEQKKGCFVPISSIINIDGVDYVYKIEEDDNGEKLTRRTEVIVNENIGENAIVENIKNDDLVVFQDVKNVTDGQYVNVSEK